MADPKIQANLIHLSYNLWNDRGTGSWGLNTKHFRDEPFLRFDENLWNDLLQQMANAGLNMVVIDVGDGIQFDSHPEISVEGAWSREKLKIELAKIRALGLEAIPKLNFSTSHDAWLWEYSRMVSTPKYYEVCADLIKETIEAFDNPRLFHLGMDEETAYNQVDYAYAVIRQYELWWHDLFFFVNEVEKRGVRAWVWSDYVWNHPEEFIQQMPKSVLQSNWYYGSQFENFADKDIQKTYVRAYDFLEENGYDQVPTGSNWFGPGNMQATTKHCNTHISPEYLKGYMITTWRIMYEEYRADHETAIRDLSEAMNDNDERQR